MEAIINRNQAAEYLNLPKYEIKNFYKYINDTWSYQNINLFWHLFKYTDNKYVELTKNVKAIRVKYYKHGDWEYKDLNGHYHLFREKNNNYIELTKNVNANSIWSYPNGNWEYKDENNYFNVFNKNNELIKKYKSS